MRSAGAVGAVGVAIAAVLLGGWWLFVRDGDAPDLGVCRAIDPEILELDVLAEHPHDPDAYTQGLLFAGGRMWESTGLRGESDLRMVDVGTGEVLVEVPLAPELFGEGLAESPSGELVQLTWTSGTALRWDIAADEPERIGTFSYEGEGWGLTTLDSDEFVMSDGSDVLEVRSPEDFSVTSSFIVERPGGGADRLNELEWDGEALWANRYRSDEILRIDMDCGVVDGVVDASALTERAEELSLAAGIERDFERDDVLNGIAVDGARMFITGKRWPVMFEATIPGH